MTIAPATIPALQDWEPGTGTFSLGSDPAVVVPTEDRDVLGDTAELLAEELKASTGIGTRVDYGGPLRPGDIALALTETDDLTGAEGYRLDIGDVLRVKAATGAGVFYGTRTVLQLLRTDAPIPGGRAVDWPRYPERGLLIDIGRRHYSAEFLRRQIQAMAYLKMNYLHVHLTENAGLRIESELHPSAVPEERLSKAEWAELVAFAQRHHVTVVPEIDMPGHMRGLLAAHPELQLTNNRGKGNGARMDVTLPAARQFAKEVIGEYLPLFPGPWWHLGGDEYLPAMSYRRHPSLLTFARETYGTTANGKDTLHGYLNELAEYVAGHGRRARIWNDEAGGARVVRLDPSIVVDWWTGFSPISDPRPPSPRLLVDRGHEVSNHGWWPTYYNSPAFPIPDMRIAYESWRVNEFVSLPYLTSKLRLPAVKLGADEPRNRGAKLSIWSDGRKQSEDEIVRDSLPHLRVIAQHTWESPLPGDYDAFLAIAKVVGTAPYEP
ncbi:beta-N-acetylhexosaminidase [Nocardioides speluncae]|uniref:beta-N-acetylhexosaminidase n=1 Tax=Nocardioides speluncae TaxID=2670337 RepID=UPI00137B7B28|nr:beta-N-acetylhexosaminidase [Nocardioides speluncae]